MARGGLRARAGFVPMGSHMHTLGKALLAVAASSLVQMRPTTAQRPEANCTFTAPSGDFYDISSLVVPGGVKHGGGVADIGH